MEFEIGLCKPGVFNSRVHRCFKRVVPRELLACRSSSPYGCVPVGKERGRVLRGYCPQMYAIQAISSSPHVLLCCPQRSFSRSRILLSSEIASAPVRIGTERLYLAELCEGEAAPSSVIFRVIGRFSFHPNAETSACMIWVELASQMQLDLRAKHSTPRRAFVILVQWSSTCVLREPRTPPHPGVEVMQGQRPTRLQKAPAVKKHPSYVFIKRYQSIAKKKRPPKSFARTRVGSPR